MPKKLLSLVFCFALMLFAWTLWNRPVHVDDAWNGECVYWLEKLGYVKSEGMRGFFGAENKFYVYHKLFIALGAIATSLFGFSTYVLKSLSLVALIISFIPLALIYRKYSHNKTLTLLLWTLYLSFFHTMNLAFTFRPELQLVALGLFGFYCLDRYLEKNDSRFLLLAGVLGAVGIASHLNGVIYVGASVGLLWSELRWKDGFLYGMMGTIGLLFFVFFDVRSLEDLNMFRVQFQNWRDVSSASYGWWEFLLRPFLEQQRFFHSPPEILYSLFLLAILIPARKYIWAQARRLCIYTLLLSFILAEVAHGANTNYLMYAFPFFMILATLSFEVAEVRSKVWKTSVVAASFFVIGQWIYSFQYLKNKSSLSSEFEKVAAALPQDVYVVAPGLYVMQGLGHQKIQYLVNYRDKVESGVIVKSPKGLFVEAKAYGNDFIILDRSNLEYFNITEKEYPEYSLWENQPSSSLYIYKRNY